MIKGVYGKPFVDIEDSINMDEFESLHPSICRDFVLAKDTASLGYLSLYEPNKAFVNLDYYASGLKPVWYFYDQFKTLPDTHPFKIASSQFDNENDFIRYITYLYGAHNPYKIFQIIDANNNFESSYFTEVIAWIKKLPIFSSIKSAYFLIVEGGGTSIEHSDPEFQGDESLHEFIYVRQGTTRPFYVKDLDTGEKIYLNTRATCFNDQDYHGSDPCWQTTYMLRIDGVFTDVFRQGLINV